MRPQFWQVRTLPSYSDERYDVGSFAKQPRQLSPVTGVTARPYRRMMRS
jgi:hypothetical protein